MQNYADSHVATAMNVKLTLVQLYLAQGYYLLKYFYHFFNAQRFLLALRDTQNTTLNTTYTILWQLQYLQYMLTILTVLTITLLTIARLLAIDLCHAGPC